MKFWCKNMFRQFFDHELSYRRVPRTRWSLNYFVLMDLHLLLVDIKKFLATFYGIVTIRPNFRIKFAEKLSSKGFSNQ